MPDGALFGVRPANISGSFKGDLTTAKQNAALCSTQQDWLGTCMPCIPERACITEGEALAVAATFRIGASRCLERWIVVP